MDFILINVILTIIAVCAILGAGIVIFANAFGTATGGSPNETPALVLGLAALLAIGAVVFRLWALPGLVAVTCLFWLVGAVVVFRSGRDWGLFPRAMVAALWPFLLIPSTRRRLVALADFPEIPS